MNLAIYSQCVQDLHAAKQYGNMATTTALLSTDLVINSVELGEDDAINESRLGGVGVISQRLVELGQLVNCFIAHKSLTNKQDPVRLVDFDQLGQSTHQWFIVLHAPCCVHQAGIKAAVTC